MCVLRFGVENVKKLGVYIERCNFENSTPKKEERKIYTSCLLCSVVTPFTSCTGSQLVHSIFPVLRHPRGTVPFSDYSSLHISPLFVATNNMQVQLSSRDPDTTTHRTVVEMPPVQQLDDATKELERKQTHNKELIQKISSLKSENKQLRMANTQLEQQKKQLMKDCNKKFKAFVDAYKQTMTQAVTNAGEAAHAMLFDLTGNSDTEEEQPAPVPPNKRPSPNNTITQGNNKRSKNE